MAKKKVLKQIKLQIVAGKANPGPPIGPSLGSVGANIMAFCKDFNAQTSNKSGVLPTVITIYQDKSFSFFTKEPTVVDLIKKELQIGAGSKVPNRSKVGRLTQEQLLRIVRLKMPDLRVRWNNEQGAINIVAGTARSMGVEVEL